MIHTRQPSGDRRAVTRQSVRRRLAVVTLGAALIAAACGDDDDDEPSATEPVATTQAPGTSAAPTTPATSDAAPTTQAGSSTPDTEPDAGWTTIVDAAKEEGKLLVYASASPETTAATEAAFEEEYPEIDVEIVRIGSSELLTRVDSEFEGNITTADVVASSRRAFHLERAEQGDFWVPIEGPNATELGDDYFLGDGHVAVLSAAPFGFAWNTNAVTEPLEITDLADPRFRGRVGTLDLTSENAIRIYDYYIELFGEDFLRGLAENEPSQFPSVVPLMQSLGAGEIDVALFATPSNIADLPVEVAFVENPPVASFYGSLTGRGDNPNAGQLFLDWLVTPDGQEAWAADSVSVLDGVSTALFSLSTATILDSQPMTQEEIDARRAALTGLLGF